jgi:hypothetical protein
MSERNKIRHGVQYDPPIGPKTPRSNNRPTLNLQTDVITHILTPLIDRKEVKP